MIDNYQLDNITITDYSVIEFSYFTGILGKLSHIMEETVVIPMVKVTVVELRRKRNLL